MTIEFESHERDFGSELKCPSCGNNYLHHEEIEVFERREDEKIGLHVKIDDGVATTDTNIEANPSPRRHGLTIRFLCEGCDAKPVLSIKQHKGNTWMEFK